MTPTASTPVVPKNARATRPEGQWALGQREPLNHNEAVKAADDALNVRTRIEEVYAAGGFDSIDPDDLRGRFRWWGLYTQRRPGLDGGSTAALEPHELEDRYFMMRVRIDGGRLDPGQLRAIGESSTAYARDTADITDRQNVQYHWVSIQDVPAIWARLEATGLHTTEACGDCPRVVIASPVAGIAEDELVDPTWAVEEIERRYVGNPEFSNLPRKFKTAITGHPDHDVTPEINDVAFVPTVHPERGPGFDLWVGGGLSTNPMFAQKLGVWVPLAEVPDAWEAVVSVFRDYGYRRLRNRARLKFLVADWGRERFRQVLEDEYLHRRLVDCPSPASPERAGDHVGVHRQKDGRYFVGVAPVVGRVTGTLLSRLADVVEAHGSGRVRTTVHQKLLVLDVPEENVESLVTALDALGLSARPSSWRRSAMACTGIEFCKLGIVDTKNRAAALVQELERRFPDLDTPITVNVNGCPNACARTQVADIGLKGQLVDDGGHQVEGFQVHLGGGLGLESRFGAKLRGHKVTSAGLDDYVTALVDAYLDQREPGEPFARWVTRADEATLRAEHGAGTEEVAS